MKFWIIEKGNVIAIYPIPDPKIAPQLAKEKIARIIIKVLKEKSEK